jgi:single-strand DNA-binding protein
MSFNKVIMAGRLTKEPERRVSGEGKTFVNFTIAVNRDYKSNEADFFDCVAFGNTADYILSYVHKGYLVLVEGSLQIDKWQDRNGVNHSKPKIIANVVKNFETKKKENTEEYAEEKQNEEIKTKNKVVEKENEFENDPLFEGLLDDLDDESPLR